MIRPIALAAALTLTAPALHATTYTIEPDHAQGVFRWDHLGFSRPAGQFSRATGKINYSADAPSQASVDVAIDLSTLQTGLSDLDEVFRSSEFFDTTKFPTATFKSQRVESGAETGCLKVSGVLNLHGRTQPVTLAVKIVKVGTNPRNGLPTIGFDATTTLSRTAFGLGAYVPQVGDLVPLHIIVEATETRAYERYLKEQDAHKADAN